MAVKVGYRTTSVEEYETLAAALSAGRTAIEAGAEVAYVEIEDGAQLDFDHIAGLHSAGLMDDE